MNPNIAAKEQAERLFFQSNMTRQQIANATGVNVRTVFDWVNQGNWQRAKDMVCNAPTFLAEQYYTQLTALNKTIAERTHAPYPTKDESEIMRRITATLKSVKTKQTRPELADIFNDFSAFAASHSPAIAAELHNVLRAYYEQLAGDGPADRLARIKTPRQAADAYQQHIKEMLDYDKNEIASPLPQEQQQVEQQFEALEIAAGIKEPHPLPQFSRQACTPPAPGKLPDPIDFYGVKWVDYMAQMGMSPLQLVRLLDNNETPGWLRPYLKSDADPFRLVEEFKTRCILPTYFLDCIPSAKRPVALKDACLLYYDYSYTHDPAPIAQPTENQHPHHPILQKNIHE